MLIKLVQTIFQLNFILNDSVFLIKISSKHKYILKLSYYMTIGLLLKNRYMKPFLRLSFRSYVK